MHLSTNKKRQKKPRHSKLVVCIEAQLSHTAGHPIETSA